MAKRSRRLQSSRWDEGWPWRSGVGSNTPEFVTIEANMKSSVAQGRYLLSLAEPILAGLDDSHRALEPQPGAKTAGWLIGHLAVSGDFARRLCGQPALCPNEWRAMFNPGTQPSTEASTYPSMTTLCDTFRRVYGSLGSAAEQADPAALSAVNPFAAARPDFPTAGDFVAYLLSSHLAYHLGQLVAWRSAAGLGRLRRPDALAA